MLKNIFYIIEHKKIILMFLVIRCCWVKIKNSHFRTDSPINSVLRFKREIHDRLYLTNFV